MYFTDIKVIVFGHSILFFLSSLGVILNRSSVLLTIISLELMLLSVNLNFILDSSYLDDSEGNILVLFILTVAAAESAVGLAILTLYYKLKNDAYFVLFK